MDSPGRGLYWGGGANIITRTGGATENPRPFFRLSRFSSRSWNHFSPPAEIFRTKYGPCGFSRGSLLVQAAGAGVEMAGRVA